MSYPSISLVTACYNHKDYIAETIESIVSQNYPKLQYVVIDDGSTDDSWKVIKKYEKYLHHCERLKGYRKSPTEALNYGMTKTNAELMGWLNSDDILLPKSLFTIAKLFTDNSEVEWLTGMASTINSRSELVQAKLRLKSRYDYLIGDWIVIQQESTFFRSTLWNKAGSSLIKGKWAFDTELWTRFFATAEHYHANVPIGAFRKGNQSKSINDRESFLAPNREHLAVYQKSVTGKTKLEASLYAFFKRYFSYPLSLSPDGLVFSIPLFKKYCYKVLDYHFGKDRWVIKLVNPFKQNYI